MSCFFIEYECIDLIVISKASAVLFGYVCGCESLSASAPLVWFVTIVPSSCFASYMYAMFVKYIFSVSGFPITLHFTKTVSDSSIPVSALYGFNTFFGDSPAIVSIIVFVEVSYWTSYMFCFEDTTVAWLFSNLKPDPHVPGNWSTILVAYPASSPSLYIVIEYVTTSSFCTITGSFLCLYSAVVSESNVSLLIFFILPSSFNSLVATSPLLFITSLFSLIDTIAFLKLKSNNFSGSSGGSGNLCTSITGCSFLIFPLSSNANHNFASLFFSSYSVFPSFSATSAALSIRWLYKIVACIALPSFRRIKYGYWFSALALANNSSVVYCNHGAIPFLLYVSP